MAPRIRPWRPEDLDDCLAVFYAAVHESCTRDYTPAQLDAWAPATPDREAWAASFATHRAFVAACENVDRPVGFADIDNAGHIDRLFVRPAHQRRGVASALLATLEHVAPGPLRALSVDASITARPFFERHGYHVVAKQRVTRRGVQLTNYRMEKLRETGN